ncbi:MAG: hypothetical protein LUG96_05290 [Tannerellaceae bacterium]|nr:hypothetical protein [Tannerellaceae bacterium]
MKEVTNSIGEYHFTHVGIVWIDEQENPFVIEVTIPRVVVMPLKAYLYPEDKKECYPISVVERLKEEWQPLIPDAIREAFTHVGKAYDHGYILNNDTYYCSELIYEILLRANQGEAVFPLNEMTFRSPVTGEFTEGWIRHFEELGMPVPEGEPGINPGAMSRSEVIDMELYVFPISPY